MWTAKVKAALFPPQQHLGTRLDIRVLCSHCHRPLFPFPKDSEHIDLVISNDGQMGIKCPCDQVTLEMPGPHTAPEIFGYISQYLVEGYSVHAMVYFSLEQRSGGYQGMSLELEMLNQR